MYGLFAQNGGLFGGGGGGGGSADEILITNDATTNATMYPVWVTANTGELPLFVSSTKFSFNPSTGLLTSTALSTSGATIIQGRVTANTSTAYSVNPANGHFFDLTLTGNCTITATSSGLTAIQQQEVLILLTQDGVGSRTLAWSGVTWDSGSAPSMPTAPGATMTVTLSFTSSGVRGWAPLQSTDSLTLGGLAVNGSTFSRVGVSAITAGSGAPYSATVAESRRVFTNEGASAEVYINLPSAVAGLDYTGIVQDSDGLRFVAAAGDTIRITNTVSATAGFANSTTIGSTIRLIAINATEWIAVAVTGTWSVT